MAGRGPDTADIPIIVLSAWPKYKKRALKAGADAFFKKPADMGELNAAIIRHLR